ncbi:hypothetical protein K458DRAFT_461267 [Lentithecium fluviatile CBS 122367]|uniref:Uncharacterized protein n=1 Tax=Lentithecium fluviatile CBS 122367 TaxID=1168545 RepID=A0A6G1INB8_9PLEO|nr:hypothetical protein K458DRAFT_461267 [Lentithecium fluviatile CBS 122367]
MRISLANLLLLGTTLAAPLQEVERTAKLGQHDSFIARGLIPLLNRAIPLRPARPAEPGPPVPHPRLNDPDAPSSRLDTPGLRPNQPDPEQNPNEPSPPAARPDEPQGPKPPARVDEYLRKHCFKEPAKNRKPALRQNYHKQQDPIASNDPDFLRKPYLNRAGVAPDDQWFTTAINNNQATIEAFPHENRARVELGKGNVGKRLDNREHPQNQV